MSKTLKRKRTVAHASSDKKPKLQNGKKPAKKIVAGINGLRWQEAALPDRLEDAEGFYGLEEIDDVDVVQDAETGEVAFYARIQDEDQDDVQDQETWSGFDDAERTNDKLEGGIAQLPNNTMTKQTNPTNPTVKKVKSSKANVGKEPPSNGGRSETIDADVGFDALDEITEMASADVTAWKELDLSQDMLSALSVLGFSDPTPIQRAAIPPIREGRDVIGKASTGSGKTLAFGIPIVEEWLSASNSEGAAKNSNPVAFILAPTRELAHQLSKHLASLCKDLARSPRIATVTGGLSIIKQQRQLEHADIIIGTPGRLWEVINSSHGLINRLKQIKFLVIDEADRLLSEGHFKEVEEILDVLNRKVINEDEAELDKDEVKHSQRHEFRRQTLVFSATFHKGLQQRLAGKQKWSSDGDSNLLSNTQSLDYLLRKLKFQPGTRPTFVDVNPISQMADNLSESILECNAMQKDLYLYSLLLLYQHEHARTLRAQSSTTQEERLSRTLVFTNSIPTVKRLLPLLTTLSLPQTTVLALHSSMPQKSRLRSLERFQAPLDKSSTSVVLIATDVAARGLDIKGIDTVIHYHVPRTADTYVHRSGRTARSLASGRSVLLCSPAEVVNVTRLISKIHADRSSSLSASFHDDDDSDEEEEDGDKDVRVKSAKDKTNHEAQKENKRQKRRKTPKQKAIQPFYLPANLPTQLNHRVNLAQKITAAAISTTRTSSESSFLRTAAEDLGVDYSSSDFDELTNKHRRGRGGGRDKKRKQSLLDKESGKVDQWKAELKADLGHVSLSSSSTSHHQNNNNNNKKNKDQKTKPNLGRRIDFGDGQGIANSGRRVKYLAGGATDVEQLLRLSK